MKSINKILEREIIDLLHEKLDEGWSFIMVDNDNPFFILLQVDESLEDKFGKAPGPRVKAW